jgi:transposase
VIGPTGAVRVMVATKPVDFRKGAEGLAALVRETMGSDPFSGAVYVFRAKRADRVKLVFWDGAGCAFTPSVSRTALSAGRRLRTGSSGFPRRSCRPCSRVLTGGACMRRARRRRRLRPADPGAESSALFSRPAAANVIPSEHGAAD